MRCDRVRFLYDEYSRGSLSIATMTRVEEHLAGCPACREFYEQSDVIARLLRRASEVAHPGQDYFEDLASRVMSGLDQSAAEDAARDGARVLTIGPAPRRRPLGWAGAVAAAALIIMALAPQWLAISDHERLSVASLSGAPPPLPAAAEPAAPVMLAAAPAGAADPLKPLLPALLAYGGSSAMVLNKSILSREGQPPVVASASLSEPARVGPLEREATQDTEKRAASLKSPAAKKGVLPSEVYHSLQDLEANLIAADFKEAHKDLGRLDDIMAELRVADRINLNDIPRYRQAKLFLAAEDELQANHLDKALTNYQRILFIDGSTRLALKASLQLADLLYNECANFSGALSNYRHCVGSEAAKVLTPIEQKLVTQRLERLERYKEDNWQPLEWLDKIQRSEWPEALAAARSLTAHPTADLLLPEAARTIRKRLADGKASDETLGELYNLLENKARMEQNKDVRAWLELELGAIAASRFQDSAKATEHYRAAIAAAPEGSDVARLARTRLTESQESTLKEPLRNR